MVSFIIGGLSWNTDRLGSSHIRDPMVAVDVAMRQSSASSNRDSSSLDRRGPYNFLPIEVASIMLTSKRLQITLKYNATQMTKKQRYITIHHSGTPTAA
jgi:hypothetical protein